MTINEPVEETTLSDVDGPKAFCSHCGNRASGGNFCSSCGAPLAELPIVAPESSSQRTAVMATGIAASAALIAGALLPWGSASVSFLTQNQQTATSDVVVTVIAAVLAVAGAVGFGILRVDKASKYLIRVSLALAAMELGGACYSIYKADSLTSSAAAKLGVSGSVVPGAGIYLLSFGAALAAIAFALSLSATGKDTTMAVGIASAVTVTFVLLGGVFAYMYLNDSTDEESPATSAAQAAPTSTPTTTTMPVSTTTAPAPQLYAQDDGYSGDESILFGNVALIASKGYDTGGTPLGKPYIDGFHVLLAMRSGGATSTDQHAFFFYGAQYLGTDATESSAGITEGYRTDDTIALNYTLYDASDPQCCATMGSKTVRFQWDGSKVRNLDALPPTSPNVDGSRR